MKAVVKSIIGPYDGPFEKNIITYKLSIGLNEIVWHENGYRPMNNLDIKVGDVLSGLVLNGNKPNYNKSIIVNTQLKLQL
jgi:hypothetical protein